MRRSPLSPNETASLIQRYLDGKSSYPQEWNDFVETHSVEPSIERYRHRCYELDPLVNCPQPYRRAEAEAEMRSIIPDLRLITA